MKHTYQIGETVVITGNIFEVHCFPIGERCTIEKVYGDGDCILKSASGLEQLVYPDDFRPPSPVLDMSADSEGGYVYDM